MIELRWRDSTGLDGTRELRVGHQDNVAAGARVRQQAGRPRPAIGAMRITVGIAFALLVAGSTARPTAARQTDSRRITTAANLTLRGSPSTTAAAIAALPL